MSTKLFQVTEDDLTTLERELPEILNCTYELCNDPIYRKRWEQVRGILNDIRWNYGPPRSCQELN